MAVKRGSSYKKIDKQMTDLAFAVPQVVSARLAQLALAGPQLSTRDRNELLLMSGEKVLVMQQSWMAMWTQLATIQVQALVALWGYPASGDARSAGPFPDYQADMLRVVSAGLRPIHLKAVANARRFRRRAR